MNILDIPMQPNDADAETIRDYLKALLTAVWEEQEGFSGKRPFGNSGWDRDIYLALVCAGAIAGAVTTYEWNGGDYFGLVYADEETGNRLILEAIQSL